MASLSRPTQKEIELGLALLISRIIHHNEKDKSIKELFDLLSDAMVTFENHGYNVKEYKPIYNELKEQYC